MYLASQAGNLLQSVFLYHLLLTMFKLLASIFRGFNTFWAWLSTLLKQTTLSYCEIQTADSRTVLVANDGSLVTICG